MMPPQSSAFEALFVTVVLGEEKVFGSQRRLAGHIIGIHALPSARYGASMEDDLQAIAVGIGQDVLVEPHGLLLVAPEEVYLDARHADALEPFHLPLAGIRRREAVARSLRRVVPIAVGVVPQHEAYALALRITGELGHALAAYVAVPPVVDEAELEAHGRCEVDELHLVVVVDGIVLPDEPAPGVAARLEGRRGLIERVDDVEGHGGLHNGLERAPHGDGAPRRAARQRYARLRGADAVELALLGEGDGIAMERVEIAEARGTVGARHPRLRHQCPAAVGQTEEAGEGIAQAELRFLRHGTVGLVLLLVRWLGAFPTRERPYLRAEEGGGAVGETEGRLFLADDGTLGIVVLLAGHCIAESHVVVGDEEGDGIAEIGAVELDIALIGHIMHLRHLGLGERVVLAHATGADTAHGHVAGAIGKIGDQAQGRLLKEGDAVVGNGIEGLSAVGADGDYEAAVGRGDCGAG